MDSDFIFIPLVLGLAGIVQGATGFGFGLTAVAVLGAFSDIKAASIVTALGALCVNLTVLWRLRGHIRFAGHLPLIFCSIICIPIGVTFLAGSDPTVFSLFVGMVLLFAALHDVLPRVKGKPWHPLWLGVPMGVLSGLLSGAFGTGGPPVVAYVASQGYDRFRYATTVQIILGVNCVVRIEELFRQGLFDQRLLLLSAVGAICVSIGAVVGVRILKWFSDATLRRVVSAMLLLLALRCFSVLLF